MRLVSYTSSSSKQLACLNRFKFIQQLLWCLVGLKGIESLANYEYPLEEGSVCPIEAMFTPWYIAVMTWDLNHCVSGDLGNIPVPLIGDI